MTTAPKSFKMAAKATLTDHDEEHEPREYRFVSSTEFHPPKEEGKKPKPVETVVVAHYPGDGVLTLMMATLGDQSSDASALGALFEILEASFSPADYRFLRDRLKSEEISPELLTEIAQDMVEGWLSFPTQPSSDSARSRPTTGVRSTGRAPGKGSTQQGSLPAAS